MKLIHPEVLREVLYILAFVLAVCAVLGEFRISQIVGMFIISGFTFVVAHFIGRKNK